MNKQLTPEQLQVIRERADKSYTGYVNSDIIHEKTIDIRALLAHINALTAQRDKAIRDTSKYFDPYFPCCCCKNWRGKTRNTCKLKECQFEYCGLDKT